MFPYPRASWWLIWQLVYIFCFQVCTFFKNPLLCCLCWWTWSWMIKSSDVLFLVVVFFLFKFFKTLLLFNSWSVSTWFEFLSFRIQIHFWENAQVFVMVYAYWLQRQKLGNVGWLWAQCLLLCARDMKPKLSLYFHLLLVYLPPLIQIGAACEAGKHVCSRMIKLIGWQRKSAFFHLYFCLL